jgi:outer membrane protein OmpA-like peptidoglycan-associated protein
MYDEYAPVWYKGGLVYCSNLSTRSLVSYQNENKELSKIFYLQGRAGIFSKFPKLLAKEITSGFNDGPVTFNDSGNVIYYSRNNLIENSMRNINDTTNRLGIYSAELVNGIWTSLKPLTYNDPYYSFTTPSLSPDGKRLFFSSDMPGGCGGMDLYYCDLRNNAWDKPVNLGPLINTSKNESFPFAAMYGILFFASDGHKGFGGKDLFYTRQINEEWISPVHLDSAINSPADDFGLVTDSTLKKGYFSTNRLRTDDIFSFGAAPEEFPDCLPLEENNFCFTLYDEKHSMIDTIPVTYVWDFGNEVKLLGPEVQHCFPGPGDYLVRLTIIDKLTGAAIAEKIEYSVHLENKEQPFICSLNIGLKDKPLVFDGSGTNLSGFRITDYFWNTGNGFMPGGQKFSEMFKREGEYTIRMGLLGEGDSLGIIPKTCVMKKVRIYDSFQELTLKGIKKENEALEKHNPSSGTINIIQIKVYLTDDLTSRQKSNIKESLKGPFDLTVKFDQSGILQDSYPFLNDIAEVLKKNQDIRLEVIIHSLKDKLPADQLEISEQWARELSFYYKNKGIDPDAFNINGTGLSDSVFNSDLSENKTDDWEIEFIFFKK